MTIKAIKTEYKGYKFRSRLEARWAVFFDATNIEWDYEPEGFKIENRGEIIHYLPDFWLPEFHTYVEVKGPVLTEAEKNKALFLSDTGEGYEAGGQVLILQKIPEISEASPVFKMAFGGGWTQAIFAKCYVCKGVHLIREDSGDLSCICECLERSDNPIDISYEHCETDMEFAYKKARQAQFEFGVKG